MLSFDEARASLLAAVARVSTERVALGQAAGRVLAEDLVARAPLPPFDSSAMDGYALAAADLLGPGPWELPLCGESRAGQTAPPLTERTAARILTGAPIPAGADTVVAQEHVERAGGFIRIGVRPRAGQHFRRAGEDLARGAVALEVGTRLSVGALALAAMLNRSELVVARRPQVTILCTGDELHAPGELAGAGTIAESNSAPLGALARQAGAAVRIAPIARDDARATREAIEAALEGTDVLLTVGGVSVGDHDLVRPALEQAGITIDFWTVAIRPGKPLAVGRGRRAHVLGLPGNPASAMVTFTVFGLPLLRAMQGDRQPHALLLRARLGAARRRIPDRLELVRAALRQDPAGLTAHAHGNQSSGAATSLASSHGLAMVPPGDGVMEAGTLVDFLRWADA